MELAEEDIYWWDALRARMVSIDDDTIDITNVTGVEKYVNVPFPLPLSLSCFMGSVECHTRSTTI